MANIFISRSVDEAAWQSALGDEHTITGQSLLTITPVPFDIPEANWLFFYSRNGVKHFFEQSHAQLAPYKWAAVGERTAALLKEYVLEVDFVGNGEPNETAKRFAKQLASEEKVCFVRAVNSRQSIEKLLPNINATNIVVYNNIPVDEVPMQEFDIAIFTSPLNAQAYYDKRKPQSEQVLAIGIPTTQKLSELGVQDVVIAPDPYEEVLLEMVKRMLSKR